MKNEDILNIFGQNLLDKKELLHIYKWLLGIAWNKPFECVWTYDECLESAYITLNNYSTNKLPYILNSLKNEIINHYEKKNK